MAEEAGLLPYRSYGYIAADTNANAVYTCPPSMTAFVTEIWISDDGAAGRTATITWTDDSESATYTLAFQHSIPTNTGLQYNFHRLALDAGDTINVTASATGVHVTVNVIEQSRSLARAR
jgi:hypothetical protein